MNTTLRRQWLRPGPWLYVMGNPDLEWVPKTEEEKKEKEWKQSNLLSWCLKSKVCSVME